MSLAEDDPYDRTRVIDALVNHAWNEKKDHKPAFQKIGINSKEELRDVVIRCIEASDTRTFKTQPVMDKKQTVPREVYEIPLQSAAGRKMVVVLNPGRDPKSGQLLGGTVYVPSGRDGTFDEVFKREQAVNDLTTGYKLTMVLGGRPALRERESHQQVTSFHSNRPPAVIPKHARENLTPARASFEKQQAPKLPERSTAPPPFSKAHAMERLTPQRPQQPTPPRQPEPPKPAPDFSYKPGKRIDRSRKMRPRRRHGSSDDEGCE